MIERARRASLAQKTAARTIVGEEMRQGELERDLAPQLPVLGAVHDAHAA